jgi:hypothetical protein
MTTTALLVFVWCVRSGGVLSSPLLFSTFVLCSFYFLLLFVASWRLDFFSFCLVPRLRLGTHSRRLQPPVFYGRQSLTNTIPRLEPGNEKTGEDRRRNEKKLIKYELLKHKNL